MSVGLAEPLLVFLMDYDGIRVTVGDILRAILKLIEVVFYVEVLAVIVITADSLDISQIEAGAER